MFAFQSFFSQEYHLQDQMIDFLGVPSAGMTKKEGERHNFLSLSHSVLHPFLSFSLLPLSFLCQQVFQEFQGQHQVQLLYILMPGFSSFFFSWELT